MGLIAEFIASTLMVLGAIAITLWTAGAIYYDVCGGKNLGLWVALGWVVAMIALFAAWQPLWPPFVVLSWFSRKWTSPFGQR